MKNVSNHKEKIAEDFPDKVYVFTMPRDVYRLFLNIFDQQARAGIISSFLYIFRGMDNDIKNKVEVEIFGKPGGKHMRIPGVTITNIITTEEIKTWSN